MRRITLSLSLSISLTWLSGNAWALKCNANLTKFLKKVHAAQSLRLAKPDGQVVNIASRNYYEEPYAKALKELVEARSPEDQAIINLRLTDEHAQHEMSFKKKNKFTGNYDTFFHVPVHGNPIPLSQNYFNELVQSMAPVVRAIRNLSQKIYSVPEITVKSLELEALPREIAEEIVNIINKSIYFEKKLVAPQMKDYPFFAVAGFDAAIGDLNKVTARFFEFNSGTPSGLSNNIQLLEILRKEDPTAYAKVKDFLAEDNTFKILKKTMDSNAQAWTGKKDGISVVIGPGSANGAHPDVASIALFSDMPLVRSSDLYINASGSVRLNTGAFENDPVVSGIYGRVEEGFFLHSPEEGIHWKIPEFLDNPELGKKWGVDLEPGVFYDFKYNAAGERIGVNLDSLGKPKVINAWDSIGSDPSRPGAPKGSFASAILNKQLYFSGLGGRVVDDKRIFEYVARYLAPYFVNHSSQVIAGPPRTLSALELDEFYKNPAGYVVKPPDMSGGAGVKIMPMLSPEQQVEVVEHVKKDIASGARRLTIQEFADLTVMTSVETTTPSSNNWQYATRAVDWRIFAMMDANGVVESGSNGFLLRTAKDLSASTNTSQGGGYGIGVILRDTPQSRSATASVLPEFPLNSKPLPLSHRNNLEKYLNSLNQLIHSLHESPETLKDGLLIQLADQHREVMDVLGRDYTPMMTLLRDFQNGEIGLQQFRSETLRFRNNLLNEHRFSYRGTSDIIQQRLSEHSTLIQPQQQQQ